MQPTSGSPGKLSSTIPQSPAEGSATPGTSLESPVVSQPATPGRLPTPVVHGQSPLPTPPSTGQGGATGNTVPYFSPESQNMAPHAAREEPDEWDLPASREASPDEWSLETPRPGDGRRDPAAGVRLQPPGENSPDEWALGTGSGTGRPRESKGSPDGVTDRRGSGADLEPAARPGTAAATPRMSHLELPHSPGGPSPGLSGSLVDHLGIDRLPQLREPLPSSHEQPPAWQSSPIFKALGEPKSPTGRDPA